jgi:hypothetical protein
MPAWDFLWLLPLSRRRRYPRHAILTAAECGTGSNASVRLSGPVQGARGYVDCPRAGKRRGGIV